MLEVLGWKSHFSRTCEPVGYGEAFAAAGPSVQYLHCSEAVGFGAPVPVPRVNWPPRPQGPAEVLARSPLMLVLKGQGERGERPALIPWFYSDQNRNPQKVGSSDFLLYSLQSKFPKVANSLIIFP